VELFDERDEKDGKGAATAKGYSHGKEGKPYNDPGIIRCEGRGVTGA
jgi:hypothetical protein